jgi:hypothetical protein
MTEEEMGAYFERRNAEEQAQEDSEYDSDEVAASELEQSADRPTLQDPSLWILKVRPGEERNMTVQLLRKCIGKKNAGEVSLVY